MELKSFSLSKFFFSFGNMKIIIIIIKVKQRVRAEHFTFLLHNTYKYTTTKGHILFIHTNTSLSSSSSSASSLSHFNSHLIRFSLNGLLLFPFDCTDSQLRNPSLSFHFLLYFCHYFFCDF